MACVQVQIDGSSNLVKIFHMLRSEQKAFLMGSAAALQFTPYLHIKCDQLKKMLRICWCVCLHGASLLNPEAFFSSIKMNNYSSLENNKVLLPPSPTPQKTHLTALQMGTSSSFFTCCSHNKYTVTQNKSD